MSFWRRKVSSSLPIILEEAYIAMTWLATVFPAPKFSPATCSDSSVGKFRRRNICHPGAAPSFCREQDAHGDHVLCSIPEQPYLCLGGCVQFACEDYYQVRLQLCITSTKSCFIFLSALPIPHIMNKGVSLGLLKLQPIFQSHRSNVCLNLQQ